MFNRLSLNGTWKLSGYPEGQGMGLRGPAKNPEIGPIDAAVPGEVHPALLAAGLIPDPFYGMDADKVRWVEEKEWWYTRSFRPREEFSKKKTILNFDGLDTYAAIWLNGQEIGRTSNMFVPHSFDVSDLIDEGEENVVAVRFEPAVKVLERMDSARYTACFYRPRVNARKQQCSFGWDWTHRLVGAGIWRGVNLVSYDQLAISDLYVQPVLRGRDADAWIYITVDNFTAVDVEVQFVVIVARGEDREKIEFRETIPVGGDVVETVIRIEDPEQWYPNGMGDQPLYTAMVGLTVDGEIQDVREQHFGVRFIRLVEENEAGDPRFTFNVNGQDVFCKGANWIPADHFPSRAAPERYRRLLQLAADANINMLRVWGGGIYEDPTFYHLCDELGIMVWQDFMFACATYPDDPGFCRKVENEARYVVKSLRNHPSVVLWCGNNENEMNANPGDEWPGKRLFHEVIPSVVTELDGTRPYRPSSPYGGSPANSPESGDWHGGRWFQAAFDDLSRWKQVIAAERALFVSEFPTLGPPIIESIRQFIPEDRLFPLTLPVWEYHNKDNPHSGRTDGATHQVILTRFTTQMMGGYSTVEEFIQKGGVLQGEFLKAEIEHYRMRKWQTSGCLFWMYDDCWPAVSPSIVDYYLRPKVAYYFVKRAFDPMIVSFAPNADGVAAWITNDMTSPIHGVLEISFVTFGEGMRKLAEEVLTAEPNSSKEVWRLHRNELEVGDPARQCLIARFTTGGFVTARNVWFFDIFRNIAFPSVSLRVRRQHLGDSRHRLMIRADDYARTVAISGLPANAKPSDNYFDLAPAEEYEVVVDGISAMDAANVRVELWC